MSYALWIVSSLMIATLLGIIVWMAIVSSRNKHVKNVCETTCSTTKNIVL